MPNLKLNRILKYILVMSAVFSFTISEGQQIFQKEYSGGQVWQQILENDNGYFFAGHKLLLGNYSHQICVYHIDHSGNIIWAKHVGDNFPAGEFVYDYTFSHDSSAILFVGQKKPTASSSYNNTLIFKMDINGNLLWFKLLGDTLNNRSFIIYPFESFYYIGGISYYNLTEDTGGLASILKIDENGSLISEFHYSFNNGTSLGIYGIFRDSSNIYIAGGYRDYLTHNSDILFTILDTSGNLISSKIFGTPMEDYVSSIISDNNGNLIISGNSLGFGNFYRYFTKIDNSGNIMWTKIVENGNASSGYRLKIIDNNTYLFCLSSSGQIVETDSLFNVKWTSRFIPGGLGVAAKTKDEGIIAAGSRNLNSYILKIDSNRTGCLTSYLPVSTYDINFNEYPVNVFDTSVVLAEVSDTILVYNLANTPIVYCQTATNIEDFEKKMSFKTFPNPFDDVIQIELPDGFILKSIHLMDMYHSAKEITYDRNENFLVLLNGSNLSSGIYILQVEGTNGELYYTKIVKR